MGKWSPWQQEESNKYNIKVHKLKLEGFNGFTTKRRRECENENENDDKAVVVEIKLKRPRSGLVVQFPRPWPWGTHYYRTTQRFLSNNSVIGWEEEEFETTTNHFFSVPSDDSFGSWDLSFKVLYGGMESKNKYGDVIGKVSLNVAETASKKDQFPVESKLPITLRFRGESTEASLTVLVSFTEVRNCEEFPQPIKDTTASTQKEDGTLNFKISKALGVYGSKKKQKKRQENEASCSDSSESSAPASVNTSLSGPVSTSGELSSGNESGPSPSSMSRVESVKKNGLWSWKRKRLSFKSTGTKVEPLIEKNNQDNEVVGKVEDRNGGVSPESENHIDDNRCTASSTWEFKELSSRDGRSKLKSNVFFASFDQRSKEAAGESACTALVTVIAHWLHSNHYIVPTRPQFDALIKEGSLEWQKLCNNDIYLMYFPNKHFDLETVLQAHLRPIEVVSDRSLIGFFSPEKFDPLKEAMSFDDMWDRIAGRKGKEECEGSRVYIVSWNDHFFVLMVGDGEYYIIDSLGERLFEGCDKAYILKFDESSVILGKQDNHKNTDGSKSDGEVGVDDGKKEKEFDQETILCKGKECCKEFMKRFFAAISVRELEEEDRKGSLSIVSLHQRLQIEFRYNGLATSVPTSPV